MKRRTPASSTPTATRGERQFCAEAAYADSIFRTALGDGAGSIAALKRALEAMPTYAPAILSMGSVEYQLGRIAEGRELFQSLLSLPKNTTDIREIIDEAGTFLTRIEAYEDGMALYRAAVQRYPDVAALWEGMGYCASQCGPPRGGGAREPAGIGTGTGESEVGQRPRLDSLPGRPPHAGQGDPRASRLDGSKR